MSQTTVYGSPVTSAPKGAPSTKNCTPATPTVSDAVATTGTRPKTVDPEAGAVIATDSGELGGTTGGGGGLGDTGGGLTVMKLLLVVLLLPPASLTVRLTV